MTVLSCAGDRPLRCSSSEIILDGLSSSSSSSDAGRRAAARTIDESVGFVSSSEIVACYCMLLFEES